MKVRSHEGNSAACQPPRLPPSSAFLFCSSPRAPAVQKLCAGPGFPDGMGAAPCGYPWYSKDEKYVAQVQADGGRLSGVQLHLRLRSRHTSCSASCSK